MSPRASQSAPAAAVAAPVPVTPGRGRPRLAPTSSVWWGLLGIVTLLAAWEISTRTVIVTAAFPPASVVLAALPGIVASGTFWAALGQTLFSTVIGLALGIAVAVPLGTVIGLNPALQRSTRVVTEFLKPIPIVALLPLALLIFGTTVQMKIMLIAFGTVWPLLIQVIAGVRSVDSVASATASSFRLGRGRRFLLVTLPSASPYIATGLRVAGVSALLLSVVTELVGGAPGLGHEIQRSQSAVQFVNLYVYVIITGVLGILLNAILERAERRVLHWHPTQRRTVS